MQSSPSKQAPNRSSAPEGSRVHGPGRETGLASAALSRSTGPALEARSGAPEEPLPRSRRPSLGALLQARVSIDLGIQSPPLHIDGDEDRISALPDDVLLRILERLDMREAVRAGAFSTRWRHLPHRLSRLCLHIEHFGLDMSRADLGGRSLLVEAMQAYTRALYRSLSPCPPPADCSRAIKAIFLCFFTVTDLTSIGHAVEDVVTRGETESLQFAICSPDGFGWGRIMSFSRACPIAFRSLTNLTLFNLWLANSAITKLISDCDRLRSLTLLGCEQIERRVSALKIDAPFSGLHKLYFVDLNWPWIELINLPKLTEVWCQESQGFGIPLVLFGHVPKLRRVSLISHAKSSATQLALSECLPRTPRNLSELHLYFAYQMIWIQMEHPKQLTATFKNLTNVELSHIFPEYDLSWTIFFLEAAHALQNFRLSRERHLCTDCAIKTNVVWEPSRDFKHLNLKLIRMSGFEDEDKLTNYIRLVMERTVCLKRIELHGENPCRKCDVIGPRSWIPQEDEARRRQIMERLTHGSSSSVEIIICMGGAGANLTRMHHLIMT